MVLLQAPSQWEESIDLGKLAIMYAQMMMSILLDSWRHSAK
jgi:hypothetical protein